MALRFSWNEAKRLATIADRGLDFADAGLFFDGRPVLHARSPRQGENRLKTIAKIGARHFTVVWIQREGAIHVISMRRAHDREVRAYRDLHG